MATMPLKDIQFPGNPNTYTFAQLDDSETGMGTTGKAPDSHAVDVEIKALKDEMETTAKVDGSYENMKVGLAENLDPTVFIEDVAAYTFRTTGGNADVGDFEKMSAVVGGSLVWNQLIHNGNFISTSYWNTFRCSYSALNNELVCTTDSEEAKSANINQPLSNIESGHKILLSFDGKRTTNGVLSWYIDDGVSKLGKNFTADVWENVSVIHNVSQVPTKLYLYCETVSEVAYYRNVQLFDLTAMFGPTIADYIYSLEQATAGAGVAWFKRYFPKDYYAYCEPHFEHTQVQAHETVGFNQWDEEWESGGINETTGAKESNSNFWRSKNFIPVLPNTTYHSAFSDRTGNYRAYWYDINKNYINYNTVQNNSFVTLDGCYYMLFRWANAHISGETGCINLHWDGSRDGEYEPYDKRSYPLDSDVVLRGPFNIDASGNLYCDGDRYTPDGKIAREYGIVDLGELNWSSSTLSSVTVFIASISDMKKPSSNAEASPLICPAFTRIDYNSIYNGTTLDKVISSRAISVDSGVCVKDVAGNYASATAFKTAMSGVYLVYPLATPTTEEADPYLETQWCNDFGTERFVPAESLTRDVEVPVGHVTKYPPDLKAKLEMTPNSPPSNGLWLVKHENGENTYVQYIGELPADPTEDGSYYLKATRSSGTTTLSWEAQE